MNNYIGESFSVGFPKPDGTQISIGLREPTMRSYRQYNRIVQGLSVGSDGVFWRMLYFSAVTITTLGYGDIVPLTNTARLIVALESILGIIIIGMFISSIAPNNKGNSP